MEPMNEILKELNEISPAVAALERKTPFSVPDDYFSKLADQLVPLVTNREPLLSKLSPFDVPTGYFETLAADILSKVNTSDLDVRREISEIAPLLDSISRENIYAVPVGYFEHFKVTLPQTKVFQLRPFPKKASWLKYLAAAVLTGVIGTAIYVNAGNDQGGATLANENNSTAEYHQSLQAISSTEIANYISKDGDDLEVAADASETDNGIQAVIQTVNEIDIKEYLKENTDPGEKNLTEI